MGIDWVRTTHDAWIDELALGDYDIVGTLKFYNGRTIGTSNATALLGAYWHKVDRMLFGKAADNGYGVERWCFTEYGSCEKNLHIHFVACSPIATRPCCAVLNALWADMHRSTADVAHNWITPIQDKRAAIAYTTKGTRFQKTDLIGGKISHTNTQGTDLSEFDIEAQLRRIQNKISGPKLLQAYKAMEVQIVKTVLNKKIK